MSTKRPGGSTRWPRVTVENLVPGMVVISPWAAEMPPHLVVWVTITSNYSVSIGYIAGDGTLLSTSAHIHTEVSVVIGV